MYRSVTVNGTRVFFTEEYYCDDSFKTSSIDELVDRGRNEICLSLDYVAPKPNDLDPVKRYGTEIESIYLTGDFGVRARASEHPLKTSQKNSLKVLEPKPVLSYSGFELDAETQTFDGNLTDAGYPFYAGSFELENEFIVDTVGKTSAVISFRSPRSRPPSSVSKSTEARFRRWFSIPSRPISPNCCTRA